MRTASSSGTLRNVLLIGNYAADRQYSMQRYASELARNLSALGIGIRMIAPPVVLGGLAPHRPRLAKWLGHIDKYLLFPPRLLLMRRRFDVVHIVDQANAIYRRWLGNGPVVVTCHDLFAIRGMLGELDGYRPGWTGRVLQRAILANLRRCGSLICTSTATAHDVWRLLRPRSLEIIPNAVADEWAPMSPAETAQCLARAQIDPDQPFFLHVGGNQFYKNRPGVVGLFQHLVAMPRFAAHRLVLAGKPPDAALREVIDGSICRSRIDIVETPDDIMLRALYSRATALLFPSLHEGFGWPIIEAQACGCVVATTDREPMRTVGGRAAICIDLDDLASAAQVIADGLEADTARRLAGLADAAQYRPAKVYPHYIDFYVATMANYRNDNE